ncbi:hypothetical protein M514_10711, partial [Trichuris suis]
GQLVSRNGAARNLSKDFSLLAATQGHARKRSFLSKVPQPEGFRIAHLHHHTVYNNSSVEIAHAKRKSL